MKLIGNASVQVGETAVETANLVAARISQQMTDQPASVLGLATGGTPVAVYQQLVRLHRQNGLSFSRVHTFNLDEYVGLAADHPQSYRMFMREQLFDSVDVDPERTFVPDGVASDLAAAAADHENAIRDQGGIDLQLLGIGQNGHIAFNEPGSALDSRTRVVDLTSSTIQANARFFADAAEVPTRAITMGIGTILESKSIVVMATGAAKAEIVRRALVGEETRDCPASYLRRHDGVTWYLDREAASQL